MNIETCRFLEPHFVKDCNRNLMSDFFCFDILQPKIWKYKLIVFAYLCCVCEFMSKIMMCTKQKTTNDCVYINLKTNLLHNLKNKIVNYIF